MKTKHFINLIVISLAFIGWGVYQDIKINALRANHNIEYEKYSYPYDCMMEAELNYLEAKTTLTREVQAYIDKVAPTSNVRGYAIVDECEKYNIDICFVLAQGEIESHFGTKGLGSKFNNIFNVDVHDKVKNQKDMKKKYIYKYPNESIEPYLQLLTTKYLVNKLESDLLVKYVDINGSRYATDINYEEKLRSKYNSIVDNTNIVKLQGMVRNYAIKCNRI
jgi:flagellum-specific peptidoglycan hydrolase FlgJ